LQRAADGAGDPQHDSQLAIAETQLAEDQRIDKGLQSSLSVVDGMCEAYE
jgi:hypothetical protein